MGETNKVDNFDIFNNEWFNPLPKEEKEGYRIFLSKYIRSIIFSLSRGGITFEEAIKSIKIDVLENRETIIGYLVVLQSLKTFFNKIAFEIPEESIKKIESQTKKGFQEDLYHKINIEINRVKAEEKWRGVFWSEEHYDAFLHVLKSFLVEEHNKTLFVGFYREYGGNKVLMRCNEKKWREWVNEHYLIKGEDSSKRWNECPQHHYTRKQIRQSQKTYKDPNIFKQPHARNK